MELWAILALATSQIGAGGCHCNRGTLCAPVRIGFAGDMPVSEEMTVRVTPELRAEIVRVAAQKECSLAAIMRHALRDWAIRRALVAGE